MVGNVATNRQGEDDTKERLQGDTLSGEAERGGIHLRERWTVSEEIKRFLKTNTVRGLHWRALVRRRGDGPHNISRRLSRRR